MIGQTLERRCLLLLLLRKYSILLGITHTIKVFKNKIIILFQNKNMSDKILDLML